MNLKNYSPLQWTTEYAENLVLTTISVYSRNICHNFCDLLFTFLFVVIWFGAKTTQINKINTNFIQWANITQNISFVCVSLEMNEWDSRTNFNMVDWILCYFFFSSSCVDIINTLKTSFSAFWMRRRTYLAQYSWQRQKYTLRDHTVDIFSLICRCCVSVCLYVFVCGAFVRSMTSEKILACCLTVEMWQ